MSGALTTDPVRLLAVPTDAPSGGAAGRGPVPPEKASDEDLAARSRHGDRAAFEQLVRRTARAVYARQYLEVGDPHRAEDLAQETFLLAWRSIGQLADPAGFRPWLLSIARSVATDAYRRDARKKRGAGGRREDCAGASERVAAPPPSPDAAAGREERRRRVTGALKSLPDEYSLPLTLRYVAGADYETIAGQLGVSNGSLRGLLSRGLAKLREKLKDLR
jgi:RNA polymerase sigma-70 factor (ECF subfamily)